MAISLGYVQMSVTSSVSLDLTPLSAAKKNILSYALVVPETNGIRYRPDGNSTAPTASVGMPVSAGASLTFDDPSIILNGNLKIISQTGTSTVNVEYYSGNPH